MLGMRFEKPVEDWSDYTKAAEWCLRTQEATIEDMGDHYEVVPIKRSEYDELLETKYKLEEWFEDYDLQVKQYERSRRLGSDSGIDIIQLDQEAVENARILKKTRRKLQEMGHQSN